MRLRLRGEEAGATYHVYGRGVDRRRIFVDDDDYRTYTAMLGGVVTRKGWHLLSFCLMPNHVHLVIETPETNLGAGMQIVHSRYALSFNDRYSRTGHLFENRFRSPIVRSDEQLVRLVGYVAVNPVAARLSKSAAEWPWGSHAIVEGAGPIPRWLAHRRLTDRLEAIGSADCYSSLVATAESAHY